MTAPALLTGGRRAVDRAAQEKAVRDSKKKASFNLWEYLRLAAAETGQTYGESITVRFVLDEPEWAETKQHSFVDTKAAPSDKPSDKKFPTKMGAVCRYTLIPDIDHPNYDPVTNHITKPWYCDCAICDKHLSQNTDAKTGKKYDKRPGLRLWAVAVEREPVIGTQAMADAGEIQDYEIGAPVSYKDVEVERTDKDGNSYKDKRWLVVNQALENFFDALLGDVNVNKTVLDRDYTITRKGSGTETGYAITSLEPIYTEIDGKRVKYDLRNPEIKKNYEIPFSLSEIIAEQASDEHYDWFFNPDVTITWEDRFGKKEEGAAASSGTVEETSSESTPETKATLAGMKARLAKGQSAKVDA